MDAKDIRNLQEAYLEVYSDLDEANKSETHKNLTPRQRVGRRQGRDFDNVLHPADYDSQGEPVRQKIHSQKRGVKTRGSGVRESVDTYDYHQLLKFLYFEGFADSYEEAEGLLEEITDEEFDEIVEAFKDLTPEKTQRVIKRAEELTGKIQHHHDQAKKHADEFTRRKEGKGLVAKAKQFAVGNVGPARRAQQHVAQGRKYIQQRKNAQDALSRTQASRDASLTFKRNQVRQQLKDLGANPDAGPDRNNIRRFRREDFDIYDIILDHLLDEGFADSIESAEAIMVNMSEEWRDYILEEVLDEADIMSVHRKPSKTDKGGMVYMKNPNIIRLQNAAARERQGRKEREKESKNKANAERYDQALKKGINKATNRSEPQDYYAGYGEIEALSPRADGGAHSGRKRLARRASGR